MFFFNNKIYPILFNLDGSNIFCSSNRVIFILSTRCFNGVFWCMFLTYSINEVISLNLVYNSLHFIKWAHSNRQPKSGTQWIQETRVSSAWIQRIVSDSSIGAAGPRIKRTPPSRRPTDIVPGFPGGKSSSWPQVRPASVEIR